MPQAGSKFEAWLPLAGQSSNRERECNWQVQAHIITARLQAQAEVRPYNYITKPQMSKKE